MKKIVSKSSPDGNHFAGVGGGIDSRSTQEKLAASYQDLSVRESYRETFPHRPCGYADRWGYDRYRGYLGGDRSEQQGGWSFW